MVVDKLYDSLKIISSIFRGNTDVQSNSFTFFSDKVGTFNGRVALLFPVQQDVKVTGILPGAPLLDAFSAVLGQDIEIRNTDDSLTVVTSSKEIEVSKAKNNVCSIEEIQIPEEGWLPLPEGFVEAVTRASMAVYKSPEKPLLHYVHCCGSSVEATDNRQIYREVIAGQLQEMLLFGPSIAVLSKIAVKEYTLNDSGWTFFRDENGVVAALRGLSASYLDVSPFLFDSSDKETFSFPKCQSYIDELEALLGEEDSTITVTAKNKKLNLCIKTNKVRAKYVVAFDYDIEFELAIYAELLKKVLEMKVSLANEKKNFLKCISPDGKSFYSATLISSKR